MDQVYSLTLLLSLACGGASILGAVVGRLRAERSITAWVAPFAVAAGIALLVSVTVHLGWGHRPGSPSALPALEFLRAHVSFVVAAVLPLAGLVARWK